MDKRFCHFLLSSNDNWKKNASIELAFGQVWGSIYLLMNGMGGYCGKCHPLAGNSDFSKKASRSSQEVKPVSNILHDLCFGSSCLQVPAFSSCDGIRHWWTVTRMCKPNNSLSPRFDFCHSVSYSTMKPASAAQNGGTVLALQFPSSMTVGFSPLIWGYGENSKSTPSETDVGRWV